MKFFVALIFLTAVNCVPVTINSVCRVTYLTDRGCADGTLDSCDPDEGPGADNWVSKFKALHLIIYLPTGLTSICLLRTFTSVHTNGRPGSAGRNHFTCLSYLFCLSLLHAIWLTCFISTGGLRGWDWFRGEYPYSTAWWLYFDWPLISCGRLFIDLRSLCHQCDDGSMFVEWVGSWRLQCCHCRLAE